MHPDIRAELARVRHGELLRRATEAQYGRRAPPQVFGRNAALYHALRHRSREIATREHQASTSATR
jgi:hypothetical protein